MRVKELIKRLKIEDPEAEVVLSRDEEGNGFCPLSAIEDNRVYIEGEIYLETLTEDLIKYGYTKEDVYEGDNAVRAIVLWP